jgi:hypothetical protein
MKYFLSLGHRFQDGAYHHSATHYRQYDSGNIDGKISKTLILPLTLQAARKTKTSHPFSRIHFQDADARKRLNMPAFWPNGMSGRY